MLLTASQQLVDPIENRYKDEEARAQATRELLKCIVDYRMAVSSLTTYERDVVSSNCSNILYDGGLTHCNSDIIQISFVFRSLMNAIKLSSGCGRGLNNRIHYQRTQIQFYGLMKSRKGQKPWTCTVLSFHLLH